MKTRRLTAVLMAVSFAAVSAAVSVPFAAEHDLGHVKHKHAAAPADPEATVKDPFCGMKIKVKDAKFTQEHKGKTYYFCMKSCYEGFKKDPGKYAK